MPCLSSAPVDLMITRSVLSSVVEEDEDYECVSVLHDHTQDVKRILWHPTEEVRSSETQCTLEATCTSCIPCRYWFLVATMTPFASTRRMVTIGESPQGCVSCPSHFVCLHYISDCRVVRVCHLQSPPPPLSPLPQHTPGPLLQH